MRDITLDHVYAADEGQVLASGLQALVRLPLDQAALDRARGWTTAGFISGYRGSPLNTYDLELAAASAFLDAANVVVRPAVNEDLAATAVWGTQQVNLFPGATHNGVFGLWYGKAPGLDRSCDVLRHATFAGTAPKGGVLAVVGDDPECKSSTLPSQSDYALMHLEIPVLSPSSVQEVLDYGLIGLALSRYAGLWVGLIATTDHMDASAVIEVGARRFAHLPQPDEAAGKSSPHIRLNDSPAAQEARMRAVKLPRVLAFARQAGLNRRVIDAPARRIGIVTAGRAAAETLQALKALGLDGPRGHDIGLTVLKLGMTWPLDGEGLRAFARDLEQIVVVEDKRAVIEPQVKEALYDLPDEHRPRVVGKTDERGEVLLPSTSVLSAAEIERALAPRLLPNVVALVPARSDKLAAGKSAADESRDPFFCPGCPHNRSTKVIDDSRAIAGIGCHYMVKWMDRATHLFSQMGGEGVQWLGQAPFTRERHVFANMGDGTYFHSGLLAVRQAVAAKVNITFKLLFNDAVAMTGGQAVDGALDVAATTRQLAAEGVSRIAVVAEDPARFGAAPGFAAGTTLHPRGELAQVERAFRDLPGTTAIVYDQVCAAEKRRRRKRGLMPEAPARAFINQAVCEGCSDCSKQSNCIAVEPVETAFGRKRRVNQSACNKDLSCVEGFCPSFVTVAGGELRRHDPDLFPELDVPLPEPASCGFADSYNILISGVGGHGITTLSATLAQAAFADGRAVTTLNRTGLAQKGGAVTAAVRIGRAAEAMPTATILAAAADLHLVCDLLVGAGQAALAKSADQRTRTVINTDFTATAASVRDRDKTYDRAALAARVRRASRETATLDAGTWAGAFLRFEVFAPMILLGFALQKGWLPVSRAAIERAIVGAGTAVDHNLKALKLGRIAAAAPERLDHVLARIGAKPAPIAADLPSVIARNRDYLRAYWNDTYAARYAALVARVERAERTQAAGASGLADAVARQAFRLMAYKDEYEVARLLTAAAFAAELGRTFTGRLKLRYHLAPPGLARRDPATGRPRKIAFGGWLTPVLKLLAKAKGLRETAFDPFRFGADRALERRLRDDYLARIEALLARLTSDNHALAVEIAELPAAIRGFGPVKHAAAAAAEARLPELWRRFTSAPRTPLTPVRTAA
jgi:indolepyruvate ferredoxin oxidoreductase